MFELPISLLAAAKAYAAEDSAQSLDARWSAGQPHEQATVVPSPPRGGGDYRPRYEVVK
jgi:hypothetical protein